jgi:hypothetical protein
MAAAAVLLTLAACTAGGPDPAGQVATVAPVEDFGVNMQRCMAEAGWDVAVTWDDGIDSGQIPPGQFDRYQDDQAACLRRFGYDRAPRPYTFGEAVELYDKLLDVAACVEELGYSVPEPPGRQAYAEHLAGGGLAQWHPHESRPGCMLRPPGATGCVSSSPPL